MQLQIGYDDFGEVRTQNLKFIDKTLFIKEVLDNKHIKVSVITRPRRFGKTFNLSTLHHFLASEVTQIKTAGMFDGLKISQIDNGSYMQYQGKYPVVFVSFKEIKETNFKGIFEKLKQLIQNSYQEHQYLLQSEQLTNKDKELFTKFFNAELNPQEAENFIYLLTSLLYKHFGKKVCILIDEYDTPIQSGYLNGYYNEIINLMRGMFGAALKTNPYLDRAVITGILRVAKESLFSGLNNVFVYSLLQPEYRQHFGFTEEEVSDLLKQANLSDAEAEVKRWYNGYIFGKTVLYNPWSIASYLNKRGVLQPYWVNTSDNQLIRDLLVKSNIDFKAQFNLLLQDEPLEKIIDENMVFGDLRNNNEAVWSLLLMSGYLKAVSAVIDEKGKVNCICAIPNWEVKVLYCDIIEGWLGNGRGIGWYQTFLSNLLNGNIEQFRESFGQVLSQTISVYDVAHNPEAFYHGFTLGLTAGIDSRQYEIKSNRESGLGRYDIAIIPKDIAKPAIILEIKSISPPKLSRKKFEKFLEENLQQEAQKALEQIDQQQYMMELVQRGCINIIKIGLAFSGKEFRLVYSGNYGK